MLHPSPCTLSAGDFDMSNVKNLGLQTSRGSHQRQGEEHKARAFPPMCRMGPLCAPILDQSARRRWAIDWGEPMHVATAAGARGVARSRGAEKLNPLPCRRLLEQATGRVDMAGERRERREMRETEREFGVRTGGCSSSVRMGKGDSGRDMHPLSDATEHLASHGQLHDDVETVRGARIQGLRGKSGTS